MSALYDYGVLKIQTEKYYFIPVSRCLKNFFYVYMSLLHKPRYMAGLLL